jgi:putative (di)nucleoside polyphosphate hydrolase
VTKTKPSARRARLTGAELVDEAANRPYRPCVGIFLFNRQGQIFIAQRLDNVAEAWQMPQGGIDPHETPRQAAMRELKEEVGTDRAEIVAELGTWLSYDLPPELQKKLWQGRYRGQAQRWFAMRFTGDDRHIDIATKVPEFRDWKWAELDVVLDLVVPFKREVYERVVTEFGPLIRRWAN